MVDVYFKSFEKVSGQSLNLEKLAALFSPSLNADEKRELYHRLKAKCGHLYLGVYVKPIT